MRKFAFRAIFAMLNLDEAGRKRPDWDRLILIFPTAAPAGLVALYVYGKLTSRW